MNFKTIHTEREKSVKSSFHIQRLKWKLVRLNKTQPRSPMIGGAAWKANVQNRSISVCPYGLGQLSRPLQLCTLSGLIYQHIWHEMTSSDESDRMKVLTQPGRYGLSTTWATTLPERCEQPYPLFYKGKDFLSFLHSALNTCCSCFQTDLFPV